MAEYIDKQTVIDTLDRLCDIVCQYSKKQRAFMCGACSLGSAFDVLQELPSSDVAPVRHGRWEEDLLEGLPGYRPVVVVCSECHRVGFAGTPYCPNCGARMDGEE